MRYWSEFELAERTGKTFGELMGWNDVPTARQFEAWQVWRELQWDVPDRGDWYLMAIACEIRRVLSRHPDKHQPGDMKLQFSGKKKEKKNNLTKEQLTAVAVAMLEARLGHKIKRVIDPDHRKHF